tara:strand:+ start:172 stop:438 length:267 start_codon:yes stop_codon:yes gene_type:complete
MVDEVATVTQTLDKFTSSGAIASIREQLAQARSSVVAGDGAKVAESLDIAETVERNFSGTQVDEIDRWVNRVMEISQLFKRWAESDAR